MGEFCSSNKLIIVIVIVNSNSKIMESLHDFVIFTDAVEMYLI